MKKLTLRIPDDLHRELQLIADEQERSLNSQILYLLRQAAKGLRHENHASTDDQVATYHSARKL